MTNASERWVSARMSEGMTTLGNYCSVKTQQTTGWAVQDAFLRGEIKGISIL